MKCEECKEKNATCFYRTKNVCSKCFKLLKEDDRSKRVIFKDKLNCRNQFLIQK